MQSQRDYVFTFSYETYSDARARGMMRPPDRLLSTLMRADRSRRLLVANPYRWAPSAVARRVVERSIFPTSDSRRLVTPLRAVRSDPVDLDGVSRSYRNYAGTLDRESSRMGLESPSVMTTNPLVAGFGEFDWADDVTYYGRDDWLSSPARQQYWPAYKAAYQRIADQGMLVAAVSQEIIDRIAPTGNHAVVPNGVEPAEWSGAPATPPAWFDSIPGPRAVYVGTIDSRLDIDGIVTLASAKPELQIVLVGPLVDRPLLVPLRGLPNVTVRDYVGRSEVVAVLRSAELCLVAHRRTELTAAMSPLKLYEYLAAGAPVISIDLPPVRGLGDRVFLVDSVGDFADVADAALASGPATEKDRLAFVTSNSWQARHEIILGLRNGAHASPPDSNGKAPD